ncbi:hypothetical protein WDV06_05445 [Streptomyces racemochromogenes]|uniref:Integral membrane protein n=1 Tax=Streptomyces racemochromogenes TaxID=67353 RepID=A0ABW7P920_9ACTN
MIFALLLLVALGLAAAIVPAVLVGFGYVVASRRLPLWARSVLLPVFAVASALLWPCLAGSGNYWWPAAVVLSAGTMCATGLVLLLHEAQGRHRPRHHAGWPGAYPSAGPVG